MKIQAHEDEKKALSELTWFEYLNVKCDERAKYLIQSEERDFVPFPFDLSSPYLTLKESKLVLNSKDSLYLTILNAATKSFVSSKLWNPEIYPHID